MLLEVAKIIHVLKYLAIAKDLLKTFFCAKFIIS